MASDNMSKAKKYRIIITSHKKKVLAKENELLADKIIEAGINLSVYCDRKGLCGKCLVEVQKGIIPSLNEREEFFIRQKKLKQNYRLACLFPVKSDLEVKVPESSIIQETYILKTGLKWPIPIDPLVKKYYLRLKKPEIASPYSSLELIEKYLGKKNLVVNLNLTRELQTRLKKNKFEITAVLYGSNEILNIESGNTIDKIFGIAIDIGTSTVVVELVDLSTGEIIETATANNPQIKFGSDVISRITFAFTDSANLEKLRDTILKKLNQMIKSLLNINKIDPEHVYEVVIAGNTTMNHFFLGIPVDSLATAPFHSVFTSLSELSAAETGLEINKQAKVYIAPNIKSFVGGDISAGLIASRLDHLKGNYLFIDLGTNGEIVLKTKQKLIATSTAAGPAFEGMNISCGMLAFPGAIYKAEQKKRLKIYTIGNRQAAGVCGTGLIDLVASFLDTGKISSKGAIINKHKKIRIAEGIYITQKDIREMQLAVGAIKSGIRMIAQQFHLNKKDLKGIFIAGAFGNYLNIKNSMRIGLLPELDKRKITFIGNSSLAGARAMLLSRQARKESKSVVRKTQYTSLATNPKFQEYFIDSLEFRRWTLE